MRELTNGLTAPLDRRGFLKSLGGGLLVLLAFDEVSTAQESGAARRQRGEELPENVAAWLHIAPDEPMISTLDRSHLLG